MSRITVKDPLFKSLFAKLLLSFSILGFIASVQVNASEVMASPAVEQQKLANRIGTIQQELSEIRAQTMQSNPVLVEQVKTFEAAFEKKAKEVNYQPEAFLKTAQEIQQQVRDENTTDEQRAELIKSFAKEKQALAKQRESIMADPELSKLEIALQKDTLSAMKKQDPKTETLLKELDTLFTQFRS
ncbi:hypothetical protein [Photobacterium profundum]|uniref:Uncharacterized protein n=1 Tax=Photobacterium profundum (strain SS9) TaxID=298386 RepID=Q6LS22_PHOPR|nr:hypothetical protein [Photobacterium profundum]CAG19904.1 hypothetical protein PBPRA1493 [Photobacterium profundum SS9]